jgi:5,10-methylenetetrahydromethanopterin reductase
MTVRFGITTMAVEPPDRFRQIVETAENGGVDYLWVCDSSLHARDVYSYLTLAAIYSKRMLLGPNCTHPFTRHPAVNFNAMATIHEQSAGRGIIVVSTGDRPVTELGYRTARVAVVREMIEMTRALQRNSPVNLKGPTFTLKDARLSFKLPSQIPVYVAASGPRMLQMAGELADGVLFLSGVHPSCVQFALENIKAGAEKMGRDPNVLDVGCTIYGSLSDDECFAREECKPMAAWFPQTAPNYAELVGVPKDTIQRIRQAYSGGHFDDAKEALHYVTDEMIDAFTVAGPASVWVEKITRIIETGVRNINIFLLTKDKVSMTRALVTDVIPRVRSA